MIDFADVDALAAIFVAPTRLFALHRGPGAFYQVIPFLAMLLPALALGFYGAAVWMAGVARFWLDTASALLRPGGLAVFSTINRNPKSYLFAVIGAEYVLGLLPRGTHDYAKFVQPSELAAHARTAGLASADIIGLTYNPLTKIYRLEADTAVNYMMAFQRVADA